MDATVRRVLASVAGELQVVLASVPGWAAAEGAPGVRTSDLQRALCNALQAQLGSVACIEGPLPGGVKEHWAGWLGRADVLARPGEEGETYFETQLCGADKLHESLWDALKLALFTALEGHRSGYLLYASPETAWTREGHHPEAIFHDGSLSVSELVGERYPELWTWCLRGTRTTRPMNLPAQLHVTTIASASARAPSVEWELRCVRIEGDAAAGWLQFDRDGWPLDGAEEGPAPAEASGEPAAAPGAHDEG